MSEEKTIVDILGRPAFSDENIQNVIVEAASSQQAAPVDDTTEDSSHDHGGLCSCCSDSRETVQMDAGHMSFIRIPGGFGTDPDGELSDDFGFAVEQAVFKKRPVVTIRQHSRCGAMAIIYAYHSKRDGEEYVRSHYGENFALMAKRRANLYNEVRKNVLKKDAEGKDCFDFSYYIQRYGIPLSGEDFKNYDDAARFQTCMAIQQGVWDKDATIKEIEALNGDTNVLFSFNHVAQNGRKYIQKLGRDTFVALPSPDEKDFDKKLEDVLAAYPLSMHERIKSETLSQQEWVMQNEEQIVASHKNMAEVQAPKEAIIRSTGRRCDEGYDFAKTPGQALFLRLVDGFVVHADGEPKFSTAQFLELARAYKVPVMQIEQVSDGEGYRAIYDYNKSQEDAEALEMVVGRPRLLRLAKRRASLYTDVKKRVEQDGFAYYEKMGVSLTGTDEEKFFTCMTYQQGLLNYRAVKELYEKDPTLPVPILFYKEKDGSALVYDETSGFLRLPRLDAGGDVVPRVPSGVLDFRCAGANALG